MNRKVYVINVFNTMTESMSGSYYPFNEAGLFSRIGCHKQLLIHNLQGIFSAWH